MTFLHLTIEKVTGYITRGHSLQEVISSMPSNEPDHIQKVIDCS